ncbi:hypothetical protein M0R72_12535 [Candidatus Pacearchaeota archaeon]|jgi:hypothetical protein|nr:hypothetical protein [Candidatus Pacearchaeota archaeon]
MPTDDFHQFDRRRQDDPQGAIDDLVARTMRQAKALHNLGEENAGLRESLASMEAERDSLQTSSGEPIDTLFPTGVTP